MGLIPPKYTAGVANGAPVPLVLVTTIELAREPAWDGNHEFAAVLICRWAGGLPCVSAGPREC